MSKACVEVLNSIENHLKVLIFPIDIRLYYQLYNILIHYISFVQNFTTKRNERKFETNYNKDNLVAHIKTRIKQNASVYLYISMFLVFASFCSQKATNRYCIHRIMSVLKTILFQS